LSDDRASRWCGDAFRNICSACATVTG